MPRHPHDRRGFIGRLAAGALALTGLSALDSSDAAAALPPGADGYDDSWTQRVRAAQHKAVFDSPAVEEGLALFQAWIYRAGYRAAQHAEGAAVVPVVVLRHLGTALALDDAIWAKYEIGKTRKIIDPGTKDPAVRNPWARARPDIPVEAPVKAALGAEVDPSVEGVLKSGGVVLVCELAMKSFARGTAERLKTEWLPIFEEMKGALVPGVIIQPSGIYSVTRAQEAGCAFVKST